jgi:hypothetical protein
MRFRALPGAAALALATVVTPSGASAQGNIRGVVRLGADFGGDPVIQFRYSDGSTPDVQAGGGLTLSAGVAAEVFQAMGHALDVEASGGVKYRTIPPASNQTANWIRVPIEGLVFYRSKVGLRVGGGVAVHVANALAASGEVLNSRVEFETKPGFVLQAQYVIRKLGIDVRYTMMKYTISSGGTGTVNANSFGGGVSYLFGT